MSRRLTLALLVTACAACCWTAPGEAASERPLASLIPHHAGTYSELHLDRLLGKTEDTAALRDVFGKMESLSVIRALFAQQPEAEKVFNEVLDVVTGLSEALGPRVGWAVWMPDMQSALGAMMGGVCPAPGPASPFVPKLLLVADVRDSATLEKLIAHIVQEMDLPMTPGVPYRGASVREFAEGQVALALGPDWLALGFPSAMMKEAADQAGGKASKASLWADAGYQQVLAGLPQDAVMAEYVSARALEQLLSMVKMLAPAASFRSPPEEGIGWAMGLRVEEKAGRKMMTAYWTAGVETLPYFIDAPLSLQAAMMYPVFERSRQSARKAVCLSNIKNLALASQMHVADHEDHFPAAERWVDELMPYLRNPDVLKCPEDDSEARCSYGMNEALSSRSAGGLSEPFKVVIFYETAHPGDNPLGGPDDVAVPPRHLGGNNFAFADGHVKWIAAQAEQPSFEVK